MAELATERLLPLQKTEDPEASGMEVIQNMTVEAVGSTGGTPYPDNTQFWIDGIHVHLGNQAGKPCTEQVEPQEKKADA